MLLDESNQPVLTPGEVGRLYGKCPYMFSHYQTQDGAVSHGEWCDTGDMFYFDAQGRYFFKDRKKNVIKTGGENVFAAEVEMVLKKHPKVVDAVVIGLPDPDWGHRIHAIVETNASLGSKELIRFALNYLPPYKIPKSIEFTDHIPVNENGKIVRSKLIEESLAKGY